MRRKRNSRASIMDLPDHIMIEVLLHLPIKGIVMFKCTCKTWHHLISSTHFAKLHYAHAEACILVRNKYYNQISRMLYLIEPSKINSNHCCCNVIESAQPVNVKLDTKLKIPLCNDVMLLNSNGDAEASVLSEGVTRRKPTIKLDPTNDHKFNIVNSCNGFLCLTTPSKLTIVCNPITNECIKLPADSISSIDVQSGFGFCQETKQYKVLRVLTQRKNRLAVCPIKGTKLYDDRVVEIHTLGSNSWKSIGNPPSFTLPIASRMYLNGVLYWVNIEYWRTPCISFEFSSERFKLFPLPALDRYRGISMGSIADCLCLCVSSGDLIDIWVMKNCGMQKSWSKLNSINTVKLSTWNSYQFQLTSCLKCEAIVLFRCLDDNIIFYDPKKEEWRNLRIHRSSFEAEAIVHTPSFFSLQDVGPGANIIPISTGFKLPGETRSPYLREEA